MAIFFKKIFRANIGEKIKLKAVCYIPISLSEILETYLPTDDKEIYIFCDSRSLKGITKKEFETTIKSHLLPLCSPNTFIQVEMIDSTTNANIQIADWISGAISRYLEKGKNGEEYFKVFKNNYLSEGKE